jgi:hypothetical protein
MRIEILFLALIVGAFTYGFRFIPTRTALKTLHQRGPLSRFLAATGPAAIATLFVASILPEFHAQWHLLAPLCGGTLAVLATFWVTGSAVTATLTGSLAYGLIFAIL